MAKLLANWKTECRARVNIKTLFIILPSILGHSRYQFFQLLGAFTFVDMPFFTAKLGFFAWRNLFCYKTQEH